MVPNTHGRAAQEFFVIGVEFTGGEPANTWVFPSIIFDKYANRPSSGSPRDLNLDIGTRKYGITLRDVLCGFKNRWELIVNFERYESMMESPEELEDTLTMKEALETPKDEAVSLGEYEQRRRTTLSG